LKRNGRPRRAAGITDYVDLSFLGEQMRQMQSDLWQVRTGQLRLDSEKLQTQERLGGLEATVISLDAKVRGSALRSTKGSESGRRPFRMENGFCSVDADSSRFFRSLRPIPGCSERYPTEATKMPTLDGAMAVACAPQQRTSGILQR
jgi:hypothetical protein